MRDKVLDIIFSALRERNEERAACDQFVVDQNTILFGEKGVLSSLDLVSTIVDIEAALASKLDQKTSLSDDHAMTADPVPFTSVTTLLDYIMKSQK